MTSLSMSEFKLNRKEESPPFHKGWSSVSYAKEDKKGSTEAHFNNIQRI